MVLRAHERPIVGEWYWDPENSKQFEIVATDFQAGLIEIQYFEGELEEIDMDTWYDMKVISIAPPKDWSGPFEVDKDVFMEFKNDADQFHDFSDPLNKFQ